METNIEVTRICKEINVNKASCIEIVSSEIINDAFLAVTTK